MAISDLIRRHQKAIFWVIIIMVVPPFVLVWGASGRAMREGSRHYAEAAQVGGEKIDAMELARFGRRLAAAQGGGQINYFPSFMFMFSGRGYTQDTALSLLWAHLQDARKAGIAATDLEVGTHLDALLHGKKTKEERRRAINELCQALGVTEQEFLQGIREWLVIRKFVELADGCIPVTDDDAYARYAQNSLQYTFKRQTVRITQEMKERALDEAYGKDKPDAQEDATKGRAVLEAYQGKHPEDRAFWSQPKYVLEYVLAPFEAAARADEVDETQIRAYYEKNKLLFDNKPLADVREKVVEKLLQEKRRRLAELTLKEHFEGLVRSSVIEGKALTLPEVAADKSLAERGVKTGSTGETPLTPDEMAKVSDIGDSDDLRLWLKDFDKKKETARQKVLEEQQKHFDNCKNLLACKQGLFRIRIVKYEPGKPRSLYDESGKVDQQLRGALAMSYQQERSAELGQAAAEEVAAQMQSGDPKVMETATSERLELDNLNGSRAPLIEAQIGKAMVLPLMGDNQVTGYEVMLLTARAVKSADSFNRLPPQEQERYRSISRSLGGGVIQGGSVIPGTCLSTWINNALRNHYIVFPEKKNVGNKKPEPDSGGDEGEE